MAFVQQEDQQTNFKHYCRVCKKGFMCGRALGGHMRAHGMGDDNGSLDEEDGSGSDWEDKFGDEITPSSNKRLYQLRTNPNRLKSFKNCENCGKEFVSWKSFLEHGKCASDDASDFLVSPPESDMEEDGGGREGGWLKRRRSPRSRVNYNNLAITDEDDILLARCLVQLANTIVEVPLSEPEESCASASREEELRNPSLYSRAAKGVSSSRKGGLFECKACNKVFTSHQALGGHRASHKKVKGCYAARLDQTPTNDDNNTNDERTNFQSKPNSSSQLEPSWPVQVGASRRKSKVHECSICHRVFTSGQALGGHKRCHWITSNTGGNTEQPAIIQPKLNMNLNVPAWASSATRQDHPRTPLSFQVSTQMQLRPWIAPQRQSQQSFQLNNNKEDNIINNNNNAGKNEMKGMIVNEDEADSEMKLAPKLSDLNELKEMQMGNGRNPSQWLQVGIGSSANEAAATADA